MRRKYMADIIIAGAGIAGMTAAVYALRAGCSVKLFERMSYGGQIINTPEVHNYPAFKSISGIELSDRLYEQAASLGAEFSFKEITASGRDGEGLYVETASGRERCLALVVATGSKNRPLGVGREAELTGRGVSYCATCDGAFFRGLDVAVAGGGNAAVEDAQFLAGYCRTVYVIHRRGRFRAHEAEVKLMLSHDNVKPVMNARVVALRGGDRLNGVAIESEDGGVSELAVSGLFIAVGRTPDSGAFAPLVELDRDGYIAAGEDCVTSSSDVFAAGDCRTKSVRQLVTAAADGAVAGLAAARAVMEKRAAGLSV